MDKLIDLDLKTLAEAAGISALVIYRQCLACGQSEYQAIQTAMENITRGFDRAEIEGFYGPRTNRIN